MEKHDIVGDVRGGYGLMTAIELVSDRETKTPISNDKAAIVQETAYQSGAMLRISGPNIILSPPLILQDSDVTIILKALDDGLTAAK